MRMQNSARKHSMLRELLCWGGVCLYLILMCIQIVQADSRYTDPVELLKKIEFNYATFQSYQDSGIVEATIIRHKTRSTRKQSFTTVFVRPNNFRFEARALNQDGALDRYIVWKEKNQVRTWWSTESGYERKASFGPAIISATGVSLGTSITVPKLLMPVEIRANSITDLSDPVITGKEVIAGRNTWRLEGSDSWGSKVTLWVDGQDMLIWKIYRNSLIQGIRREQTVIYSPKINIQVDPALLSFKVIAARKKSSAERLE